MGLTRGTMKPCFSHVSGAVPGKKLMAVKVCGIVSPEDAELVVSCSKLFLPSDTDLLLGMIIWPNSRRSVSADVAKQISIVARKAGATPVGVFVDESVDDIRSTCNKCGINVAQLHGPECRSLWSDQGHKSGLQWIDVCDVHEDGSTSERTESLGDPPLWTLFDAKGGGTGKPFDWERFRPPGYPWLLAGGLDPDNVQNAVDVLQPAGLDVASGVAGADRCAKDEERLELFLKRVGEAYS